MLLGDQRPRLRSVPPSAASEGERVATLAKAAGLHLDDWERWVLDEGLGRTGDGSWSAFEKALIVSRQNGKGAILEALELAALFIDDFGADLILHSAHEFKTAAEAFRRIQGRIENTPSFRRRVKQIYQQRGAESIELRNGKRLRFIARTGGSGRGFTADLVILDEAFELGDAAMSALLPTLSARPNPQIWYTSTAGLPTSTQLGLVRSRGVAGDDPSLAFFEWSVDPDDYDPADPVCWAQANPGLGIRISASHIEKERLALPPVEFARERLGVGDYPVSGAAWRVVPQGRWLELRDPDSEPGSPVAFAAAFAVDRKHASVLVAGQRADGAKHVEVGEYGTGTGWVVPWLIERHAKHGPCAVVVDAAGPEGSIITELEDAGVEVLSPSAREVAQAFGQFHDAVMDSGSLRHRGDVPLDTALGAADVRDLADGKTWARKGQLADVSPVVAATLALWGFSERGPSADVGVWMI